MTSNPQTHQQEKTAYFLAPDEALALATVSDLSMLMPKAATLRDEGFANNISYSRKVFIPLTQLCRDVCHYCTFAQTPKFIKQPYMTVDEVLVEVKKAEKLGCKEALFTLGEKPELRYQTAANALKSMGFDSTIAYLIAVAERVLNETQVLPHVNPGTLSLDEMQALRKVSASMGMMLESASNRLCQKGMPHYGSPDKLPAHRLETLRLAGMAKVPFTTGILIGIGETRGERIESLLAIRDLHVEFGHIQEVIIQNFRAKPSTKMAQAPEPDLEELLWTIAVARLIFGPLMSIQAPPNLSPGVLPQLINAGINDWGGVSPVTPDFVNPEAPWPNIVHLANETRLANKHLLERMTIYPDFCLQADTWLDPAVRVKVMQSIDAGGWPKEDSWQAGISQGVPSHVLNAPAIAVSSDVSTILHRHNVGDQLSETAIKTLFQARGQDFHAVCDHADDLRRSISGDAISFVINRNINYTNVCYFNCRFCAFSKGKSHEDLRGKPYQLSLDEIQRRTREAKERGASEITLQGGIHPSYDGNTYLDICRAVKSVDPDMHIHGFTPLEVWHGAATLNLSLTDYLQALKSAGLGTIPGTAAEILCDDIRAVLCADKINTEQWLAVMREAHNLGIKSTATIMFGHIEGYQHWARHLIKIRQLQMDTQGFTELVPLPFVSAESPIYLKQQSRNGPSLRESILMHAVSRIVLAGFVNNIQGSWVKLGQEAVKKVLNAGANDLGGTLMNESITKAAGASHGQELPIGQLESIITDIGREPVLRNTLYQPLADKYRQLAYAAKPLKPVQLQKPIKSEMPVRLIKPGEGLDPRQSIDDKLHADSII